MQKLNAISSSAGLDQAFMKSIQAHSIAALWARDLWFEYCNGGMLRGASHKSHGCEQLSSHTVRAGAWDDPLWGHSLLCSQTLLQQF